jgi:hypothetical protein
MGITYEQEKELVEAYGKVWEGYSDPGSWAAEIEAEEAWVALDRELAGPWAKEHLKPTMYYETPEGELYLGEALIELAADGVCTRRGLEECREVTPAEREEMYA